MLYRLLVISLLLLPLGENLSAEAVTSCSGCHFEIYDEWEHSRHSMSWTSDEFRTEFVQRGKREDCGRCHASLPIFESGSLVKPEARMENLETGVDCLTCHAGPDNTMHGPAGSESSGHFTTQDQTFTAGKAQTVCLVCHEPMKGAKGFCVECHMPSVIRLHAEDPTGTVEVRERTGGQHGFQGAHNAEFFRSALDVHINNDVLTIRNTGSAHPIPRKQHHLLMVMISTRLPANQANNKTLQPVATVTAIEIDPKNPIAPQKEWIYALPFQTRDHPIQVELKFRFIEDQKPYDMMTIGTYIFQKLETDNPSQRR